MIHEERKDPCLWKNFNEKVYIVNSAKISVKYFGCPQHS